MTSDDRPNPQIDQRLVKTFNQSNAVTISRQPFNYFPYFTRNYTDTLLAKISKVTKRGSYTRDLCEMWNVP